MRSADLEHVLEQLSDLGGVVERPMFGGHGLYRQGVFFGLVDRTGTLYFHTDEETRAAYREAGSAAFRPARSWTKATYWEVPPDVLASSADLAVWADRALSAARARKRARGGTSRARGVDGDSAAIPIRAMRNLGPASASRLREVGIETRADLERLGSVAAWVAVSRSGRAPSLNLLWAMEAALLDLDWRELPPPVKESLRQRVERLGA